MLNICGVFSLVMGGIAQPGKCQNPPSPMDTPYRVHGDRNKRNNLIQSGFKKLDI